MPTTTVVVCTRNRAPELSRCLRSLSQLDGADPQLVVVDNTAGDAAVESRVREFGAAYVIEPRVGLSRARNAGVRAATGELVAFIDDDAEAEPEWLARHVDAFQDPSIGASTGRVRAVAPSSEPDLRWLRDLGDASIRIDRSSPEWFERANFGGLGIGVNMAFRRSVFEQGLTFSECLGLGAPIPGGEEHYAFFSVIRAGHAAAYVPEALVRHPTPADPAALAERRGLALRAGVGYLLMLILEERGFRRRALRYALEGAVGRPRGWSDGSGYASGRAERREAMAGALDYLRARSNGGGRCTDWGRQPVGAFNGRFTAGAQPPTEPHGALSGGHQRRRT